MALEPLDEIRFWQQVLGEAKRTVVCRPEMEASIQQLVDQYQIGHIITVRSSTLVPEGKIFILAEQTIQAAQNAALQQFRFREGTE